MGVATLGCKGENIIKPAFKEKKRKEMPVRLSPFHRTWRREVKVKKKGDTSGWFIVVS